MHKCLYVHVTEMPEILNQNDVKKQDKEREITGHKKIPVKPPQTLHTMRFSITKLFWAISCISSFSAKAFFSARKDVIILKSISNTAFPSAFRTTLARDWPHCSCLCWFTFLRRHLRALSLLFVFLTRVSTTSRLRKWKLFSVIYEACRLNGYHVSA